MSCFHQNLIGVYESRESKSLSCGVRKWERGIVVSLYNTALLFGGHGRSFQEPSSKSFRPLQLLLSSISPPKNGIPFPSITAEQQTASLILHSTVMTCTCLSTSACLAFTLLRFPLSFPVQQTRTAISDWFPLQYDSWRWRCD